MAVLLGAGSDEEIYIELVQGLGETLVGNYPGTALRCLANKAALPDSSAADAPRAEAFPEDAVRRAAPQPCLRAPHEVPLRVQHLRLGIRRSARCTRSLHRHCVRQRRASCQPVELSGGRHSAGSSGTPARRRRSWQQTVHQGSFSAPTPTPKTRKGAWTSAWKRTLSQQRPPSLGVLPNLLQRLIRFCWPCPVEHGAASLHVVVKHHFSF